MDNSLRSSLLALALSLAFFFSIMIVGLAITGCASQRVNAQPPAKGTLSLVSMGAGDPDNMTLRAQKAIAAADIVFTMGARTDRYGDILTGKLVYDAGHRLFYYGASQGGSGASRSGQKVKALDGQKRKPAGQGPRPHRSSEEIDALREKARRIVRDAVANGKHVVILDNGDPTIFGPHIGYMREFADLNPEIVPGLSSFNAANAALQTSVVAGESRVVALTIGRLDNGRDEIVARMIGEGSTLAFFMVRDLEVFIDGLNARLPGNTPVAIVAQAGSRARQKIIRGTLDTILSRTGEEKLPAYLLYVGESLR
jgi:precorrin-4/cobalt-precorrin-4 C11-methyltransferase